MSAPMLEIRSLSVHIRSRRGVVHAVDDVSLTLLEGEALGIAGESGSGKTTLLRAVLGLLPRSAHVVHGEIIFEGVDLLAVSAKQAREVRGKRIGMVFQDPMTALNPVMPVGDQVSEGPRYRLGQSADESRRTAMKLLTEIGIPDPARRYRAYAHQLSGGMRQRIDIAIALSCRPHLLLCDEPTTALDVTIQDQILRLLKRLSAESGLGMLYVTHDLAVIAQTCPTVAVMYAGQVVERGPVAEVFSRPRHPYTRGLLASVPDVHRIGSALEPIQGTPPDLHSPPSGCRFHPRCPLAQVDCLDGDFPLLSTADDRATACIHSERMATTPLLSTGL